MQSEGVHQQYVDDLVAELSRNPRMEVFANVEYHQNGYDGEFDVLARYRRGYETVWQYYEVKCSRNPKAVTKAQYQAWKAQQVFKRRKWEFFLVTPDAGIEVLEPQYHRGYKRVRQKNI